MDLAGAMTTLIANLDAVANLADVTLDSDPEQIVRQSGFYLYEIDVELEHNHTRPVIATRAQARLTFVIVQHLADLPDGSTDATAINELVKKFDAIENKLIADAASFGTGWTAEIDTANVQYSGQEHFGAVQLDVLLKGFQ